MGTDTKQPAAKQSPVVPSRRAQRHRQRELRARRRIIGAVCGCLVIAGVLLAVWFGGGATKAPPAFAGTTIEVVLGDYTINGNLTAPAGEVRLHAVNNGGAPHDVGLKGGPMSNETRPGLQTTVDLGSLAPGTYELYCNVEDHEARGMVATLVITAPLATTTS